MDSDSTADVMFEPEAAVVVRALMDAGVELRVVDAGLYFSNAPADGWLLAVLVDWPLDVLDVVAKVERNRFLDDVIVHRAPESEGGKWMAVFRSLRGRKPTVH